MTKFQDLYNTNTINYDKLSKEEKHVISLQGKMDHSTQEYQRETYIYAILNIITIVTAIAAYKYLVPKIKPSK